jgi:hypothetical protein
MSRRTPGAGPGRHAPRRAFTPTAWLRWASTPCSWLRQACTPCSGPLRLRTILRVRRSPRVRSAPTVCPDGHALPCSWLRQACGSRSWLRWAETPTSIRPDNRKRPEGKLLTLMRRLTVCISRRRENEAAERERALAGSKTEDRPAYAGRLHACVRRRREVCLLAPTECPDWHAPRLAYAPAAWLRWASTPCSWLRQACGLLLRTSVVTHDIACQALAAGTERPDRRPGRAQAPCSWLRQAWCWSSWLRWAETPTSIRPDNRKRPEGKLLTLMRRLTVKLTRRRNDGGNGSVGKHTCAA